MSSVPQRRYTEEDYLQFENGSPSRHEYYRGEIFAMTGGTERHALIISNVMYELRRRLKAGVCRVYSNDLRIRVESVGLYTYADVPVVCGKSEHAPRDANAVTNPTLLVEVLSPSTEVYDRNEKRDFYFQIPALRHYMLVAQKEPAVEIYTRDNEDHWLQVEVRGLEGVVNLSHLKLSFPLADFYRDVEFDTSFDSQAE